jgi:hypothetical protein
MAIDEKRRNEIAYLVLKHTFKERGFEVDQSFRRRVGNMSKHTGVQFSEMLEFSTKMTAELLAEVSENGKPPTNDELEGFDGH